MCGFNMKKKNKDGNVCTPLCADLFFPPLPVQERSLGSKTIYGKNERCNGGEWWKKMITLAKSKRKTSIVYIKLFTSYVGDIFNNEKWLVIIAVQVMIQVRYWTIRGRRPVLREKQKWSINTYQIHFLLQFIHILLFLPFPLPLLLAALFRGRSQLILLSSVLQARQWRSFM